MNRFKIGAILSASYEIPAQSEDDARKWAYDKFPTETEITLADGTPVKIHFLVDDVHTITPLDIMDTTNNHCRLLVTLINRAWQEKPKEVAKIVRFLAERDCEDTILALRSDWDACHDYCQHVADDKDLNAILHYCRM